MKPGTKPNGPEGRDVIMQLAGGLGNQLFQYAAGLSLATRLGSDLWLDTRAFDALAHHPRVTQRTYELAQFALSGRVADPSRLRSLGLGDRVLPHRPGSAKWLMSAIGNRLPRVARHGVEVVRERSLAYSDQLDVLADRHVRHSCYLIGYWQSPRYFAGAEQHVRAEVALADGMSEGVARLADQIEESRSLCVHVRRGDLVTNKSARQFHGLLGADYYQESVDRLVARQDFDRVFVFSDDAAWCREHLRWDLPIVHVDQGELGGTPAEHLVAMSRARGFVISNSTYSWWAAWLSGVSGESIVAPRAWTAKPGSYFDALVPSTWTRV